MTVRVGTGLLACVLAGLWSSLALGQPPPPPTLEQIGAIVKAAVSEATKPLQDSLSALEARVKLVEARPGAIADAAAGTALAPEGERAAVVEEVTAEVPPPGDAPPVVPGGASAPANDRIVPREFWSVEMAKKSGLYYTEPALPEAIKLLKTAFKNAAAGIPARPAEFNQRIYMDLQIKLFEEALVESGRRQENQIQAWKNFWELWMAAANATLTNPAIPVEQRRELFRQAFTQGLGDMDEWVEEEGKAHDEGTKGTTGRGSAGDRATSGSLGSLPPLAAYHHAKHLRRMRRLDGRIQAFRSY